MTANPAPNNRRDLPAGTVTILFTDIQGSTELLKRLGDDGYVTLVTDHNRLMREAIARYGGTEVRTQGDSFFVTFPRAPDAVSAAVDAQRSLTDHAWPGDVRVLVRMGLHTGQPWVAVEDYEGIDIHRAARIAATGHGGQVLLSETTTALVRDDLPEGVSLEDLGIHRLKDMRRAEQISQLVIPGLPSEFPPIKTLEALPLAPVRGAIRGCDLLQTLGKGVFGEVFLAYQPTVRRNVAIKTIVSKYANNPDFIRRFEAEAQVVASLEHPHIVPLYDYWRQPDGAYLVMRYLRGGSLEDALTYGPWKGDYAVQLVDQVSAGLAYAHRQGVVHRDIKPANILLDEGGNAYLSDFGIATLAGSLQAQLDLQVENKEETDLYAGSLGYQSPETADGKPATQLSDIYSLGVVLYQLVTAQPPFPDLSGEALIEAHRTDPLPSVVVERPEIPPAVDEVIQKATAKDPSLRYPNALQLAAVFRQAILGIDVEELPEIPLDVENPYKGLRAFQEADASEFFGRLNMIERLVSRLGSQNGDVAQGRFLAVVGPSGSGKSSLVRAGLVPALRRGEVPGSDNWFIVDMIPGLHPYEELEAALLRVAVNPPASLLEQLQSNERGFVRAVKRCLPPDKAVELLLVVDQFEELFTLVQDPDDSRRFLDSLHAAVIDPFSRVRLMITLRADFYDRPLLHPYFSELVQEHTEVVVPLTADELTEAVERPARNVGGLLETGLTARIVTDVHGEPGALPLLQYALTELFESRDNATLTQKAYQEIGGVLGALGIRAEALYQELDKMAQVAAKQIFLRLVTLGEGTLDTRRRALMSELEALGVAEPTADESGGNPTGQEDWPAAVDAVIGLFGGHRLLTFDRDPVTREPTVEVAHEALLGKWVRLRGWLDESRADVRLQRVLGNAAAEWLEIEKDASYLLRGSRLEQYEGWAASTDLALTADELSFLYACLVEQRLEAAAETARQEHERSLKENAMRQASIGLASQVKLELMGFNPERAVPLALEALENYPYTWQAESALSQAVLGSRIRKVIPSEAVYYHHDLSPDGTRLLSGRENGTVSVYDISTGTELFRLTEGEPIAAAWSPDGTKILSVSESGFQVWDASGSLLLEDEADPRLRRCTWYPWAPDGDRFVIGERDGTARLIDSQTGESLLELEGHEAALLDTAWSPSGKFIITAGHDNKAILWNADSGDPIFTFPHETENGVRLLAWSPSERYFALSGEGLHVYETLSGNELFSQPTNPDWYGAAWSPDEEIFVATRVYGGEARAWNTETWELMASLSDLIQGYDVTWSPTGDLVSVGSVDGSVRVWDPRNDRELMKLYGMSYEPKAIFWSPTGDRIIATGTATSSILEFDLTSAELSIQGLSGPDGATWSPDGSQIARSYPDGTVTIYAASTGDELMSLDSGPDWAFRSSWSPSGDRFLTINTGGQIKIWDASTGELQAELIDPDWEFLFTQDWSPDGKRLAAIDYGKGGVIIWDTNTWEQLLTFEGHPKGGGSVAWSPDGTQIISTSLDGKALIWDPDTGQAILNLFSEGDTPWVAGAEWSHDGSRIAVFDGEKVGHIFDAQSGEELVQLCCQDSAWEISWSPSDERILSAGGDGTVKVWDVDTGVELIVYNVGGFTSGAFSPDGTKALIATTDGTTRVYPTWQSYQELIAFARECCLVRELTPDEREQFGLPVEGP